MGMCSVEALGLKVGHASCDRMSLKEPQANYDALLLQGKEEKKGFHGCGCKGESSHFLSMMCMYRES